MKFFPMRFIQKILLEPRLCAQLSRYSSTPVRLKQSEVAIQAPPPPSRKLSALELQHIVRKGNKLTMITAYDFPSAKHAEYADIDIVLVGDSVGMVVLGYDTTQPVTMDDMIYHCKAVRRGAPNRFIVGDMPFGSYEEGPTFALHNAMRFIKEAGVDAVKLEGGAVRAPTVQKLVESGIAVMGHVGLTPQGVSVLGGFRAQGRTAIKAKKILDDAMALQRAGAFSVVIECVPEIVARAITGSLKVPTIGIGAGRYTNGQVLVYHDVLGMMHHPHHEKHVPSFCKKYATLGSTIHQALSEFRDDVRAGDFPGVEHSPYKMAAAEMDIFKDMLVGDEQERQRESADIDQKNRAQDEYEAVKLY